MKLLENLSYSATQADSWGRDYARVSLDEIEQVCYALKTASNIIQVCSRDYSEDDELMSELMSNWREATE
jgi:hypothetical protein